MQTKEFKSGLITVFVDVNGVLWWKTPVMDKEIQLNKEMSCQTIKTLVEAVHYIQEQERLFFQQTNQATQRCPLAESNINDLDLYTRFSKIDG